MEDMKVIVRYEGDPYWMNPDNLLLALRSYCPNTKFECEYLIHPSKDLKKNTYFKIMKRYRKKNHKINKKLKLEGED